MYIAMNRFKISNAHAQDFIDIWKNRNSLLGEVPGFKAFQLLQGEEGEDYTLFISHSSWESKKEFENWTQSESFRKAHGQAKAPKGTYLEHPQFEGFEVALG